MSERNCLAPLFLSASTRHGEVFPPMPTFVRQWPLWRVTFGVFLPFAAAYYLSYLFRTINAVSASRMIVLQNPVVLSAIVAWSFGVLPCSALPLRELQHQGVGRVGQGNR